MKLIFEIGSEGRKLSLLPECDVPETAVPEKLKRRSELHLPHLSENEISRHRSEERRVGKECRLSVHTV